MSPDRHALLTLVLDQASKLAIMEPHYRLPFLSWLPNSAASLYLRMSRRGSEYAGIRFLTYGPLTEI